MSNQSQAIVDRVRQAAAAVKQSADQCGVADPTDKGEAMAPKDPALVGLPPNKPLTAGVPSDDQTLNPSGTGQNVPSTESQNAKDDAAQSPTTPLSKIAGTPAGQRLQNILAACGVEKAAGAAPADPASIPPASSVAAPQSEPSKTAGELSLSQEVLAKLASEALQTEEGMQFFLELRARKDGEKVAADMIREAVEAHHTFNKAASAEEQAAWEAYAQHEQAAEAEDYFRKAAAEQLDEVMRSASDEDRAEIEHLAKLAAWAENHFDHPLLKRAFEQGMMDAGADMDAEAAGEPLPTGEEVDPAEIEQLIASAVESGALDPETAAQLLDGLASPDSPDGGTGMEGEMEVAASLLEPARA